MQLEELVKDIAPHVRETVLAELTKGLTDSIGWEVKRALQEEVSKYVIEHVLPDVQKQLQADHPKLVAAMVEAVHATATHMRDRLVEVATAQLASDHVIHKVMKETFGRGY